MTDQADNQIWGYYYGAGVRGKDINFDKYSKGAPLFVISANHSEAFLHVQNYCIEKNIAYLYDPGMSLTFISDKDLEAGIRSATYIVGNDYEIAQIERRLKKPLLDIISKDSGLITTLGAQGIHFQSAAEDLTVGGCAIDSIIDPTGAGDAWRGGFIGGLLEGLALEDSLKRGNALASFAINHVGTVNHSPSSSDVLSRAVSLSVSK